MATREDFKHVDYTWDDQFASKLTDAEKLVYRSNLLGADQRITNTGGGNTSSKTVEKDPLTGESVDVMWVKGSGGDLRTSTGDNFSSLYLDKLLALEGVYDAAPEKGAKTEIEDAMVGMYHHATYDLNPRAYSVDTPLHGFIPYKHVDHMHPSAVISVAACKDQVEMTKKIFGDEIGYIEWQRPGFDLGLKMRDAAVADPKLKGLMMGQHGIISWADDSKECYDLTLELIEKAARYIEEHDRGEDTFGGQKYRALDEGERRAVLVEVLPWLRGQVSQNEKLIATKQTDAAIQRFVNSHDAARLAEMGTSCPDHFSHTKIKPLYVDWDPQNDHIEDLKTKLSEGLEQYRKDYATYYENCKRSHSPAMRDPNPRVILIPGVGMVGLWQE